jgi:hypothetical protein
MRPTLLLCCTLLAITGHAQVFMRPFDNAAVMAMGGASIALPGLSRGLNNDAQAGLLSAGSPGVWAGSAIPYGLSGWQTAQIQGVVGLSKGSGLGLDIAHSATSAYSEQRFRLAYGRQLGEKIFLGGSADVLRVSAQEYGSVTAATFSLSILAKALPTVWLGAKLQNPLQQKIGDDIPVSLFRVGAVWKPSELFLFSFETEKDLERPAQIKAGFEYRPHTLLAVRAGMRTGDVARIGFGAGLRLKNGLALDVGSEWHPSLGITPAAMISWRKE